MTTPQEYAARRNAHRCLQCGKQPRLSGKVRCADCLIYQRQWYRQQSIQRQLPPPPGPVLPEGPAVSMVNRIGCCGRWIDVVQLPLRCPRCDRVYGLTQEGTHG